AAGLLVFSILGVGLIATPSPGSIFALLAMTPKTGMIGLLVGVLASTAVSFAVASVFIKRKARVGEDEDIENAEAKMKAMKAESKFGQVESTDNDKVEIIKKVSKIIVACDAGMGSSAMGATTLRNKIKKAGLSIEVVHCPVDDIPTDAEIVVTHRSLSDRAKSRAKLATHISIDNFIKNKEYDQLVESLKEAS
ncbi:MAG: PTS mannitol transporter subunit IIBC, partial [Sarcina sp.]